MTHKTFGEKNPMHPVAQFHAWLEEAKQHPHITEPTAMCLATATQDGKPSARIVLLKEANEKGFVFYSNNQSRKGIEIVDNPYASLCFYWMPLDKQVRIEGRLEPLEDSVADAYFASRPREKQIGAWASAQSRPLTTRESLDSAIAKFTVTFEGKTIPRPPHWSGWRLVPETIEFWQQRDHRLHVRDVFMRTDDSWQHGLLYP